MAIETLRHIEVFNSHEFDMPVHIIGCGAIGSKVGMLLGKLGAEKLYLYDFDKVNPVNIPNQVFTARHVGMNKAEALADLIEECGGKRPYAAQEKVDATFTMAGIIVVMVDTMEGRSSIWHDCIKAKPHVKFMVEARMGADQGRIYSVNPHSQEHIDRYEETLYSDEEAEVSACGASTSVGATSEVLGGAAAWMVMRKAGLEYGWNGYADDIEFEVLLSLRPFQFFTF